MGNYSTKSALENKSLHEKASMIIKKHLEESGYDVQIPEDCKYIDYIMDGKKCKVSAHQNINDSVVIEYATDKHHILSGGF